MELLDINYLEGFVCEECGPIPAIVVCDATTIGFQRKFVTEKLNHLQNLNLSVDTCTKRFS